MKVYAKQDVGKRREYETLITPEAYEAVQEPQLARKLLTIVGWYGMNGGRQTLDAVVPTG
jgi:hypothetical protein